MYVTYKQSIMVVLPLFKRFERKIFEKSSNVRATPEGITRTHWESRGQATTQMMPCPMDQANHAPSGEKSTLHVSHPASSSSDGGRLVFSSRRSAGSDAAGRGGGGHRNGFKLRMSPSSSAAWRRSVGMTTPTPAGRELGDLRVGWSSALPCVEHISSHSFSSAPWDGPPSGFHVNAAASWGLSLSVTRVHPCVLQVSAVRNVKNSRDGTNASSSLRHPERRTQVYNSVTFSLLSYVSLFRPRPQKTLSTWTTSELPVKFFVFVYSLVFSCLNKVKRRKVKHKTQNPGF